MTLTIDLTPTEQERVAVAARQKGLDSAEFVKKLVTASLPIVPNSAGAVPQIMTVEDKIRAMDAFAEKNRALPILSDDAFDRENLYEERF